jgi:hypothetical protein
MAVTIQTKIRRTRYRIEDTEAEMRTDCKKCAAEAARRKAALEAKLDQLLKLKHAAKA